MKQVLAALNDVIAKLEEDDLTVEAAAVQEVFERLATVAEADLTPKQKSPEKTQPKK